MSRHRRGVPLLSVLSRLGWRRDSSKSATRCLDERGRNSLLQVRLGPGYVTLECPSIGLLYLSPLQVGRLRAALRDAVFDLDRLGGGHLLAETAPPAFPEPAPNTAVPRPRQVVAVHEYQPETVAAVIRRARALEAC
ncbi:hypothetical protein [Saccharothrix sp.]|uniref:hypothetical protein n=1 Tax=Saccharothrix sp. TaxID=1873460 RepID=UPI00281120D4|nr:hypothetical protein [Saccharothrix sp.]